MDSPTSIGSEGDLRDEVIEALNNAKDPSLSKDKLQNLTDAQEILLHRDESKQLLISFGAELAEFHIDKKWQVRMFVIQFIEAACKACPDMIPLLIGSLVFLVQDKKINCQMKAWVTVMNLYRPALAYLCLSSFYETSREEAPKLRDDLFALKDAALEVMNNRANKVMPIYETVKTISLSFLSPDPNRKDRERRMPTEARVDTTPDSFSLAHIPRDHPDLSLLELEKIGVSLTESLCKLLSDISESGDTINAEDSRNARPIINSLQILAVYRPSVRKMAIENLVDASERMAGTSENVHKLGVVQSLSTNLLELLKEEVVRVEWRNKIFAAVECVGGEAQAQKLLSDVDNKEREETKKRQRQEEREEMATLRPEAQLVLEAKDAEHLRQYFDYPPQRSQWTREFISTIHELPAKDVAELIIMNMNNLPGPPPTRNELGDGAIRTFAQFATLIDSVVGSMAMAPASRKVAKTSATLKGRTKAPGDLASVMTPLETIEPRKQSFEQMLRAYSLHVPSSSLYLFSSSVHHPSNGDVMIARAACNYLGGTDKELDLRPKLIKFVATDITSRLGLALSTLYHIYTYAVLSSGQFDEYDAFFMELLKTIFASTEQVQTRALSRLFTTAPRLPEYGISVLNSCCVVENQLVLGLSTLRDVIVQRQAKRDSCLRYALFFAVHKDLKTRESAVRLVRHQLYTYANLASKIENFATAMLNSCLSDQHEHDPDVQIEREIDDARKELLSRYEDIEFASKGESMELVEDDDEEEGSQKPSQDAHDVEGFDRRISLYLALCTQKYELLPGYMKTFANATNEELKKIMESRASKLIELYGKSLGPAQALMLFQGFPNGAVSLVTCALKILISEGISDSKEKRSELVGVAKAIQNETKDYVLFDIDDKFVIPVLGCLDRGEIESYLVGILAMETQYIREAINSILLASRFASHDENEDDEDTHITSFSPEDLMLFFVNMPITEDISAKSLLEATDLCFERKDLYTRDVLASVISSLLSQDAELPMLTMRILIKSMDMQPKIKPFIAEALSILFERCIWETKTLFDGWLLCATLLETQAYPMVLRLPATELKYALDLSKKNKWNLHARLVYYAKNNAKNLNLDEEAQAVLKSQ